MRGFNLSEGALQIIDTFPEKILMRNVLKKMSNDDKNAFLRLWITEGIPYAFKKSPMLYEYIRSWLGSVLLVEPKDVTIIGSGRIGYSLAPEPNFGRMFDENSDLDFSVINNELFKKLCIDFYQWSEDYKIGKVAPRNQRERKYWDDNKTRLPNNIARGFIDPYKIPNIYEYNYAKKVNNIVYMLGEKIKMTTERPITFKSSLRVYKSQPAFFSQLFKNLNTSITSVAIVKENQHRVLTIDNERKKTL